MLTLSLRQGRQPGVRTCADVCGCVRVRLGVRHARSYCGAVGRGLREIAAGWDAYRTASSQEGFEKGEVDERVRGFILYTLYSRSERVRGRGAGTCMRASRDLTEL